MPPILGTWPGTKETGLVTDNAVRRCDNCDFYKLGNCYEKHLVADPENKKLLNDDGKSIRVKPNWCSNFFEIKSGGLTWDDLSFIQRSWQRLVEVFRGSV